ncbi:MAG: three-Cys-motif partner protein TcmP [Dehalococcoidales bacterium]|nr:three-Cys-motif partner protein TcmP [Dehalococcoidales bacterium]
MSVDYDVIGFWSEIKHSIIKEYARAYSAIVSKTNLHHVYIDAFAGPGDHISEHTKRLEAGLPKMALEIKPPFKEYYFIDLDEAKVEELNKLRKNRPNVHVFRGDCNKLLLAEVFPKVKWADYKRGLCILDPYGLDLSWEVIETAGKMQSMDMFLNFPIQDINRNVLRRDRDLVYPGSVDRMNNFWGDMSWEKEAFSSVGNMFGYETKVDNDTFANAFKLRLETVAGFKHVLPPIPMKNSMNSTIYYLFFASQQGVASGIVGDIFKKYKILGAR